MTEKEQFIEELIFSLGNTLNAEQLEKLRNCLVIKLNTFDLKKTELAIATLDKENFTAKAFRMFFIAKKIEGLSDKSLNYYKLIIVKFIQFCGKEINNIETDDVRYYLATKQINKGTSRVTIDNERRILNSFFQWLEDERYITVNPVRRIKHVKQESRIKKPFSDEELERLRDGCDNKRDLAIVDVFASTGMRVGEMELLNRQDVNFGTGEIVVFGKGSKERVVYLNAKAKIHLQDYLNNRSDNNEALFTTLRGANRLLKGGIETLIRLLGKKTGISNVHPHRFRRTAATMAINRGMPIEQVQKMLGHAKIDTTVLYAIVSQKNVKISHEKYLS